MQQVCVDRADWDDPVPESLHSSGDKWRSSLSSLEKLKFPRCIKPVEFSDVEGVEMHHFSDASSLGYGQCTCGW